jgi:hypothetical protein
MDAMAFVGRLRDARTHCNMNVIVDHNPVPVKWKTTNGTVGGRADSDQRRTALRQVVVRMLGASIVNVAERT